MSVEETDFEVDSGFTTVTKKKKAKSKLAPEMTTRNRTRADVGPRGSAGRKSSRWHREQDSSQDVADGIQHTIPEICKNLTPGK